MKSPRMVCGLSLALLVLAPLAGGLAGGLHPAFAEFPPLTQYVRHAPFSPVIFGLIGLLFLACFFLLLHPERCGFERKETGFRIQGSGRSPNPVRISWPWWGSTGAFLTLVAWICAWGRFGWLGPLKVHCFFPLWMGYILVMDALNYRRKGASRLSTNPKGFWVLFPASSLAWWYYEYLNRFVQNWWYEGVDSFSPAFYTVFATLCFSTVLPAVFETTDWIASFDRMQSRFADGPRIPAPGRRGAWIMLLAGTAGLILLARFPNPFFFMVWLAPLLLLLGGLEMAGVPTFLHDLARGDHRPLFSLSLAALFCGFFWEMWNFWSLPKWHYTVPYVNAFRLFEMPIVGYSGYLPFGPVCWCIWRALQSVSSTSIRNPTSASR